MVASFEALRLPAFPAVMLCSHCLHYVYVPGGWMSFSCCPACYLVGHSVRVGVVCRACAPTRRLP